LPSIATTEQKEAKIAWEVGHPERSPWTQYLLKVIDENKSDLFSAQDIQIFCPKFGSLGEDQKKLAIAQLFSAISKFESDFVPTSRYVETTMGKDCITNKQVVSEGLFQLSYCDKTWQPKCAFDWEKDKLLKDSDPRKTILDPYINTECAVSIMAQQVKIKKKIMPLVESVEYLNKKGYIEKGIQPKKNVAKWIEAWKALHIFKEPHVNDPVLDASIKLMRKLVASTTMWFNVPANAINVFVGNYNNWRAENAETLAKGNARLFGGKGERGGYGVVNKYALDIIKKYNIVNQDYDSQPTLRANNIFAKMANIGTQLGEYQIQGSLALGLLNEDEFNSFEFTKDKYGNDVLTVKPDGKYTEDEIKAKMTQIKNRVTDIQGKYPDEDRRNIMRGEFGKALFQFKVWMPDWFKERFGARYINAYGQEKEGSYTKMLRIGIKEMAADLKKGDIKKALTNPAFVTNLKGMITIGALLALKNSGDDEEKKKGGLNWDNMLSQVLFIFDLEQDKYMVSNPAAVLGKLKDLLNAFEALVGFEEDAWEKTKRVLPANKAITFAENQLK
jgi:hypothetical protein